MQSATALHDARRLLESLVPLAYRPAIKAALLDSPLPLRLAELIGAVLAPRLADAEAAPEAAAVLTMALEVAVVLCDPGVCLDPLAPPEARSAEDAPPREGGAALAAILLAHLQAMGPNAPLAHRALRLLASAGAGRCALRAAVLQLHPEAAAAAGGEGGEGGEPSPLAVAQAAQLVANRYYLAAQQLGGEGGSAAPGAEAVRSCFSDVVAIMQQMCAPEAMAADRPRAAPPAPARFVAALQAALAAAAAAGEDVVLEEHRWEAPAMASGGAAAAAVADAATRFFWRNVAARGAQSSLSRHATLRRFTRLDCRPDPDDCVAAMLHPPLTQRSRQRHEAPPTRASEKTVVAAAATPSPHAAAAVKREPPPSPATAAAAAAAVAAAASSPLPAVKAEAELVGLAGMSTPAVERPADAEAAPGSVDLYGDLSLALSARRNSLSLPPAALSSAARAQSLQEAPAALSPVVEQQAGLAEQAGLAQLGASAREAAQPEQEQELAAEGQQQHVSTESDGLMTDEPPEPSLEPMPAALAPAAHPAQAAQELTAAVVSSAPPAAQPGVASPPGGELGALLANPAALQALMKDPTRLARLLEQHPSLMQALKSRLGK